MSSSFKKEKSRREGLLIDNGSVFFQKTRWPYDRRREGILLSGHKVFSLKTRMPSNRGRPGFLIEDQILHGSQEEHLLVEVEIIS